MNGSIPITCPHCGESYNLVIDFKRPKMDRVLECPYCKEYFELQYNLIIKEVKL